MFLNKYFLSAVTGPISQIHSSCLCAFWPPPLSKFPHGSRRPGPCSRRAAGNQGARPRGAGPQSNPTFLSARAEKPGHATSPRPAPAGSPPRRHRGPLGGPRRQREGAPSGTPLTAPLGRGAARRGLGQCGAGLFPPPSPGALRSGRESATRSHPPARSRTSLAPPSVSPEA